MKLALLGTDGHVLQLAAAAQEMGHVIAWVGDIRSEDSAAVADQVPRFTDRSPEWELLLGGAIADAVLVGTGRASAELRAEQLKRLTAECIPLLVVHPACLSVLPYYELDMTRRETGAVLRHYNPIATHAIVADLAGWVREGHPTIGRIHQLSCERHLEDDARPQALAHLARDVELLASAAGDIRRVTAIGPRIAGSSFASLQIQLSSSGPSSLRWSVRTSRAAGKGLELTLIGEGGTAALRVDEEPAADRLVHWELETISDEQHERRPLPPVDAAAAAVQDLAAAVAETDSVRRSTMSTWEAATRAMEVVDAVELSLEKGRTIDVYQQQLTERLAFRGTMAALGCGLIFVGLATIVLVTLLGGAEGVVDRPLLPAWPLVLLGVFAFFLLLQVIPLLVRKSKQSGPQAALHEKRDR